MVYTSNNNLEYKTEIILDNQHNRYATYFIREYAKKARRKLLLLSVKVISVENLY